MSSLIQRFAAVLSGQQSEIASLKQQLAEALADDAADDAAVEAAEAAAAAAQARAEELQQLVDADAIEDQQLDSLLAAYEPASEIVADAAPEASTEPAEEIVADPAAEAAAEPAAEPAS